MGWKKRITGLSFLFMSFVFCLCLTACDYGDISAPDNDSAVADDTSSTALDSSASADTETDSTAGTGGTYQYSGSTYEYSYNDKIRIPSYVNGETVTIAANIYIPVVKTQGEIFPAIVFINSWGCNEYEYAMQAQKFARKGYVVLSYECRGWYKSGGEIAMGTETDWIDFSNILDWLLANAPVDVKNIGVAGISLGGGGSLHAISRDPRVKTAAAMSSYIDAYRSMYSGSTPRLVWGSLLAVSGALFGNLADWIWDLYFNTMKNTNIDWVRETGATQSPLTFIDRLNRLNKPVYLSHNFGDYMFMPNLTMEYYNALTVDHKRLDLCQGTHATAEMPGVASLPNYTFDNVHRWFDYWLKGIDTGMIPDSEESAVVTMQVKGTSTHVRYDDLQQWPPVGLKTRTFYCAPGVKKNRGMLATAKNGTDQVSIIRSGFTSGASAGVPIITPLLEGFNVLFTIPLGMINTYNAMVYQTGVMDQTLRIRGIATVNLRVALSGKRGQVFAYLYDVDGSGNATFITHAFQTWWDAVPGAVMEVPLEFVANAYDIEPGHRLALVIDTQDSAYGAPTIYPYNVSFVHDDIRQMALQIPVE